jgi:hypothetical protein
MANCLFDNPVSSIKPERKNNGRIEFRYGIAERNGGINGFFGVWDLRVSKKFSFGKTKRHRLEISADLFNIANALNKKWGASKTLGNQAIYSNKGFDAEGQRFNYGVNTAGVVTPSGNPYQGQLGIRYSF